MESQCNELKQLCRLMCLNPRCCILKGEESILQLLLLFLSLDCVNYATTFLIQSQFKWTTFRMRILIYPKQLFKYKSFFKNATNILQLVIYCNHLKCNHFSMQNLIFFNYFYKATTSNVIVFKCNHFYTATINTL